MTRRTHWLRHSFERLFRTTKRPYCRRPERLFYRPTLDYLEDRTVLSTLNIPSNPGVLTFTAGANQAHTLSISLSGGNYTIADTAAGAETITLTGTGTAAWTGNGTTSVTGPASSVTTMVFDLTVGGTNTVTVASIANPITSLDGGPSGNNTLIGPNNTAVWDISGANSGTLTGAGAAVTFANFQNLIGGTGNDTFFFSTAGASLAGTVDGGGGANLILGNNVNHTWSITGANAGSVDFILPNGFTNAQSLGGGTGNDDFVFSGSGALSGTINGNVGANTIQGSDNNHTWNITSTNGGDVPGMIGAFFNIQNLTGGTGNDDFVFADGAGVTGTVDGRGGVNALDYSAYTTGVVVNLGAGTATGAGGVANIQQLTGGQGNDSLIGNSSGITDFIASPGNDGVDGNGSNATLIGFNAPNNTWSIVAANMGTVNDGTNITTFTNVQNLVGGAGADAFAFQAGGSLTGTIDGGGGANSVTGDNTGRTFTVTAANAGTIGTILPAGFTNVQTVNGGSVADTLVGTNANNTWNVTGPGSGNIAGLIAFMNMQNLTGGTGDDNFVFGTAGSISGTLDGGGGNNRIQGNNNNNTWAITGANAGGVAGVVGNFQNVQNLVGGTGTDILDFSAAGAVAVIVTGAGSLDGVMGTAAPVIATFDNMNSLVGGAGSSLRGPDVNATWTITGSNAGALAFGTTTLPFSGFPSLIGGSANDGFTFAGGSLSGTIDGGGGGNTITGDNAAHTWAVTGTDAGTITVLLPTGFTNVQNLVGGTGADTLDFSAAGAVAVIVIGTGTLDGVRGTALPTLASFDNMNSLVGGAGASLCGPNQTNSWIVNAANAGTLNGTPFSGFPNLLGSTGTDTFTFQGAGSVTSIDGRGGTNTIVGNNSNNTWNITGANAGGVPGMVTAFQNIQNLTGGIGTDTFVFTGTGAITDLIDGGPGAGTDKLDLSALSAQANFTLAMPGTSHGFKGTASAVVGSFDNILVVAGSTSPNNTLTSALATASSWLLSGPNAGTVTSGSNSLAFSNFPNIVGNGSDTLVGTNAINTWNITGPGSGNVAGLIAFSGMRNLTGGNMDDTFVFQTGGSLTGTIDGGLGNNKITGDNTGRTYTITGANAGNISGILPNLTRVQNLTGGAGNDTFVFQTGGSLSGTIDGGGGNNTIQGDDVGHTWNVTGANAGNISTLLMAPARFQNVQNLSGGRGTDVLDFSTAGAAAVVVTGAGTLDGVMGTAAPTLATFDNMNSLVGGAGASLCGPTIPSVIDMWSVTGLNAGTLAFQSTTLPFSGFPNLLGGSGDDLFAFAGGNLTGMIDGRAGNNTIQGDNSSHTWNVTGANAGNISVLLPNFVNVQNLTGGSGDDSFVFQTGGSLTGTIDGGLGGNKITGDNANRTWNVTGPNAGTVSGILPAGFTRIQNLTGGNGNDLFTFTTAASAIFGTVGGGGGINGIVGNDNVNAWLIDGYDSGRVPGMVGAFQRVQNLTGGANTDVFGFTSPAGFVEGNIDGRGGRDALSYISLTQALVVTVTGTGSIDGFQGKSTPGIGGIFSNIDVVYGANSQATALIGQNLIYAWKLDGPGTGRLSSGANTLDFLNFQNLGGSGSDTLIGPNRNNVWYVTGPNSGAIPGVIVSFSGMANLTGSFQADYFALIGPATVSGKIDGGGAGVDTIDWSAYASPRSVKLMPGTTHGFGGQDTSPAPSVGSFDNIDVLTGLSGSASNVLTGPDQDSTWNIVGTNTGLLVSGNQSLFFSNFPNLQGGNQSDFFAFGQNGAITGYIDGGAVPAGKKDTLGWGIYPAARNVSLTGFGGPHGYAGADPTVAGGFRNIDQLKGSDVAPNNSLTGLNASNSWAVNGFNAGTYTSSGVPLMFSGFQNLVGGGADDAFLFSPGGTVTGRVDGGGAGAGQTDLIDWSGYGSDRNVTLAGAGSIHGFAGTEASLNRFDNIDRIKGNQSGTGNTLTGDNNASTWVVVADPNLGSIYSDGVRTLRFSFFQILKGGSGANTFNVLSTAAGAPLTIMGFSGSRPVGGNDVFNLGTDGNPADGRTLAGLLGPVTIMAGSTDGVTTQQVTCGGAPFATIPVGNQLNLDDQDDTTQGLTYNLTENQFTRTLNGGNTIPPVNFTGIASVVLNGGRGNDNYNVALSPDQTIEVMGGPGSNSLTFTNLNQLSNRQITANTVSASGVKPLCFQGISNLTQAASLTAAATLTSDAGGQHVLLQLANSTLLNQPVVNFPVNLPAVVAAPSFSSPFGFGPPSVAVGKVRDNNSPFPDLIVGLGAGFAPLVTVYDGAMFFTSQGTVQQVVAQFYAYDSTFRGGVYVATGKLTSTTRASIITGAGQGGGPHVEAFDYNASSFNATAFPGGGVNLAKSFFAYPETPFFGGVRVAAGHVHPAADGLDDIITAPGPGGGPNVRVFYGQGNGGLNTMLQSFFAYAPNFFGGVYVAAGNYANHADGHIDILTGAGFGGGPHVQAFDSRSLALEASFFAFESFLTSGVGSVAFAAPQLGGGNLDIFVGSGAGRPAVFRRFLGTGGQPTFNPNDETRLDAQPGQTFSGVGVFVGGFPLKQGS